jgi:ferredoxin
MTKYKIILDRRGCIGAFTCAAVNEDIWEIDEQAGKVNLKLNGENKILTNDNHEVIIDDESLAKKVADTGQVCPVFVIKVINMETGEDLVK